MLEDLGEAQRPGLPAEVSGAEVLEQPLADQRERDRHVREAHDIRAALRLLAPRDALGGERGAAQAAVDGVVRGDLDRGDVGLGLRIAVSRRDARRRDLEKVLGHAAARKITEVPRPPVIAASMTSVAIL